MHLNSTRNLAVFINRTAKQRIMADNESLGQHPLHRL